MSISSNSVVTATPDSTIVPLDNYAALDTGIHSQYSTRTTRNPIQWFSLFEVKYRLRVKKQLGSLISCM